MAGELPKQKLRRVASTFLFEGVDEIVVEGIVRDPRCRLQRFQKNQIIFDETHFMRCLGIILVGTVRVDKETPDGKRMKMSDLSPGECFGAASMFSSREVYATRLMAQDSTEILFIPEEVILWAMHRNFHITENYIRYLSNRIWFLNEKISGLTAGSVDQRVSVFLMDQCDASGRLISSMTELSRQLNIGRASLYRALDALEEKGLIRREGKQLFISEELRACARSK